MDSAMCLEAPANGIIYTCVELRGNGSLLEISKPSDLEEQLKRTEKKKFSNQTVSRMPHAIEKKAELNKPRMLQLESWWRI